MSDSGDNNATHKIGKISRDDLQRRAYDKFADRPIANDLVNTARKRLIEAVARDASIDSPLSTLRNSYVGIIINRMIEVNGQMLMQQGVVDRDLAQSLADQDLELINEAKASLKMGNLRRG